MRSSFSIESVVYLRYLICGYKVEVAILLTQLAELIEVLRGPTGARRYLNSNEFGFARMLWRMIDAQMKAEMTGYFVARL